MRGVLMMFGFFGGVWSVAVDGLGLAVVTLVLLMGMDYITGLMQAIYNKKINSEVGYRGLVRKVYFLLLIFACYLLEDLMFGTRYLADGVTISFAVMEFISIVENGVRMNAPFTSVFKGFLHVIKKGVDD